jgi:adenosylcobinamide-GDP ribazoletransferase
MRSGGVGPFGAAAVVVAIGAQAFAFGALAAAGRWAALVLAVAAGRVAVVWACGRGTPAAEGSRFGALVADSQSPPVVIGWLAALLIGAIAAEPLRGWAPQGALAAVLALAAAMLVVRHCVRRFGGLSGDVLGASIEVTVAVFAVVACAGG